MNEITSVSNPLVKEIVKFHQKKNRGNLIILEGKKAVEEAKEAGLEIQYIFSDDKTMLEGYKEAYFTNEKVMAKISTTKSPANVLAVAKKPEYKFEDFKKFKRLILLDGIKDSGNLGTIIRTAAAFGIEGILLFNDCTDEFSTKTIRSAAGNIFKVPMLHCTLGELKELKKSFKIAGTIVNSKNLIKDFMKKTPKNEPLIVMFGSEACGLCEELLNITDDFFTIPMKKGVESLNLAMSTGIVLYEMFQ